MSSKVRKINEVIIHCTASKPSSAITTLDVKAWHIARGFSDIGYHYIIDLDGRLYHCRPEIEQGAHCKGHNANSIGIAYIGGLDDVTGKPADTRTKAQRMKLNSLILDICSRHNILAIWGHNRYAVVDCPCFDVIREYNHFLR